MANTPNYAFVLTVENTRPMHGGKITTMDRRVAVLDRDEAKRLMHETTRRYREDKGYPHVKKHEGTSNTNMKLVLGTHEDHNERDYGFVVIEMVPVVIYKGV